MAAQPGQEGVGFPVCLVQAVILCLFVAKVYGHGPVYYRSKLFHITNALMDSAGCHGRSQL
jgi:hypothetical protein